MHDLVAVCTDIISWKSFLGSVIDVEDVSAHCKADIRICGFRRKLYWAQLETFHNQIVETSIINDHDKSNINQLSDWSIVVNYHQYVVWLTNFS